MDTKVVAAAKWSLITDILAKLITPITNIILAHILAPTAFWYFSHYNDGYFICGNVSRCGIPEISCSIRI